MEAMPSTKPFELEITDGASTVTLTGDAVFSGCDTPPPTNTPPSALFDTVPALGPVSGKAPFTVKYTAARSSDADKDPLTYSWQVEYPNGSTSPAVPGVEFSFTYPAAGRYVTRLTVSDGKAQTAAAVVNQITAPDSPPVDPPPTGSVMKIQGNKLYTHDGKRVVPVGVEFYTGNDNFPGPGPQMATEILRLKPNTVRYIPTLAEQQLSGNFSGTSVQKVLDTLATLSNAGVVIDFAPMGGTNSAIYSNAKYKNGWKTYEKQMVLHKGESYANDDASWVAETKAWITAVRNAGWTAPILVWSNFGGRNWSTIRRNAKAIIDHDPAKNVGFGVQLYWTGDTYSDLDNTTDYYPKMSGVSLRQAVAEIAAFPYYVQIGVCTNQGDQAPRRTPWKGLIDLLTKSYPDLPWLWWDWSGGGLGDMAFNYIWAGPLSTDPVPPGRTVGTWHVDTADRDVNGVTAIDAKFIAETILANSRKPA